MDNPAPPYIDSGPIGIEQILQVHLLDQFCTKLRRTLKESLSSCEINDDEILLIIGDKFV